MLQLILNLLSIHKLQKFNTDHKSKKKLKDKIEEEELNDHNKMFKEDQICNEMISLMAVSIMKPGERWNTLRIQTLNPTLMLHETFSRK